ncbi:hypothetical protein TNCV_3299041 [Trichonephila clavipes]|uniref:Uncharacterized protein n=1 Tax=Trichonephila clavipes TaxID=2585209 RepID=A0A8X7B7G0_TRICX|nr:hypothetical protein TNCV_3299041 [Trichonephila clavipes]
MSEIEKGRLRHLAPAIQFRRRWSSALKVKRDSSLNTMRYLMPQKWSSTRHPTPDDPTDVVWSKEDVLNAAVTVTSPEPSALKW